jgi:YHS domain-containing protein
MNENSKLRCEHCYDEVAECENCGNGFEDSQEIICLGAGEYHFCSEKCMYSFLRYIEKYKAIPAKVFLDDV